MRKILLFPLALFLGLILGILLLEPVFRSNPTLLPRGIAAPLPVDPPLTDRRYEVRYTDADIFYWQPDLVRPPEENLLEAVVHWQTDEFGFPNPAPTLSEVDLVILGRSYAMGAQASDPWPSLLRGRYGYRVLNLSQTGAGLQQKRDFLERFALPRGPRYAVIEILPPFDILGYGPAAEPTVIQRVLFPFARTVLRRVFPENVGTDAGEYIYPLRLDWADGGCDCVFYSGYLAPLSLSKADWAASEDWMRFRTDLIGLVETLRGAGVVPILLFVPTKETIYLPLVADRTKLTDALALAGSWELSNGKLHLISAGADPNVIGGNVGVAAELLREFAGEQSLCLADPTASFVQAVESGIDPFMGYDTHWGGAGHALVAQELAAWMESGACR